jgi:hypothetical protein
MDASTYLSLRRNMFQAEFFRLNPSEHLHGASASELYPIRAGVIDVFQNGKLIMDLPTDPVGVPSSTGPAQLTVSQLILGELEKLFVYNASISLGPTRCARIYYLFFASLAGAYSWISGSGRIYGTKDNWDWEVRNPLPDSTDQFVWMTQTFAVTMPNFIPGYEPSDLLAQERTNFGWTTEEQNLRDAAVKTSGNFTAWQTSFTSWLAYRAADGNVAASAPPANADLPNGATVLDVTTTQNFSDATAYPNPRSWTPLKVQGAKKNYLTYGWGTILSTGLTAGNESAIKSAAQSAFLGTTPARDAEVDALVTLAQNLTDEEKIIAEFWAGGPNTVAPPGISIWFWKQFVSSTEQSTDTIVYSGLDLAIHLFETSRLVWALKGQNMEARPIQEIRRRYAGQTLTNYDGTPISGALWVPYQATNFVTPPFPDFPSGHSAFSQTLANVMTDWFSATPPSTDFTATDLNLLTALYKGPIEIRLTLFPILAGSSEIQPGTVPATPLTLTWNSWQALADSAGVSRQYGGIHCASAHTGGQSVANTLHPLIKAAWSINHS